MPTSPFLPPRLPGPLPNLKSSAGTSISNHAPSLTALASTGVSSATRSIQHLPARTPTCNLSLLPDMHLPVSFSLSSPIKVFHLQELLRGYSSPIVNFLVNGFSFGFRIGFMGDVTPGCDRNNRSALSNKEAVSTAILKEVNRGHTLGPFTAPPFDPFHCSPLGSVPKRDGSYRLILDLSSPTGLSINDGIPSELFTVKYSSFDDAVSIVRDLGPGCFMAKIDIKHAFRLCPVNPKDWPLLGYKWLGKYFFDVRLPFGSRSSPFIFNTFADALAWILIHKFGITCLIHYLDDFFVCANSYEVCLAKVKVILRVFVYLGVPIAEDKLEGPSQSLVFLGIHINSVSSLVSLSEDKTISLRASLKGWLSKKKCVKSELLSLIGSLSFACKVIKPGRVFLRRLIDLSMSVSHLHHHIDLNSSVRSDISMWSVLLEGWNGVSLMQKPLLSGPELKFFTDASFSGFGAFFDGRWFSSPWPRVIDSANIAVLELFAVFASIVTWGDVLANRQILIFSDNDAIVQAFTFGSSRNKSIMLLLRKIFFVCFEFNISLRLCHLPGSSNVFADLLSRLQVSQFLAACPEALLHASSLPASIWDVFTEI